MPTLQEPMQRARVIGHAVATAKHPSMHGHKLLVVQPLAADGGPDELPLLVVDTFGAGVGSTVVISSDGRHARDVMGSVNTPIRYTTIGLEDARNGERTPLV